MRWAVASLAAVALIGGSACKSDRTLGCESTDECVRSGVSGLCLLPGFCAFADPSCTGGLRWDDTAGAALADSCVDSTDGGPGETNACGGRTVLAGAPGDRCGLCNTGIFECEGGDALACAGEAAIEETLTAVETSVTSVFDGDFDQFGPDKALDGLLTTSWFSDGPGEAGKTTFRWRGPGLNCIQRIDFAGNGGHPQYPQDFGFAQVTVAVEDDLGQTVFSKVQSLPGTPDEDFSLEVGLRGVDVVLTFEGSESPICGGFAELAVIAVR